MSLQQLKRITKNMRCENRLGVMEYALSLADLELSKPARDLVIQESLLYIQRKQLQPSIEAARRVS